MVFLEHFLFRGLLDVKTVTQQKCVLTVVNYTLFKRSLRMEIAFRRISLCGLFKVFTEIQQKKTPQQQSVSYSVGKSRGQKIPVRCCVTFCHTQCRAGVFADRCAYTYIFFTWCVKFEPFLEYITSEGVISVCNMLVQRRGRWQQRVILFLVTCFNMAWALKWKALGEPLQLLHHLLKIASVLHKAACL